MSFSSNLTEPALAVSFSGNVLICTHPSCHVAIPRGALDRHLYRTHHLDKAARTRLITQVPPGSYVESLRRFGAFTSMEAPKNPTFGSSTPGAVICHDCSYQCASRDWLGKHIKRQHHGEKSRGRIYRRVPVQRLEDRSTRNVGPQPSRNSNLDSSDSS